MSMNSTNTYISLFFVFTLFFGAVQSCGSVVQKDCFVLHKQILMSVVPRLVVMERYTHLLHAITRSSVRLDQTLFLRAADSLTLSKEDRGILVAEIKTYVLGCSLRQKKKKVRH